MPQPASRSRRGLRCPRLALYQSMAMTFWLPETEAALALVEER